jgi:hypothetical protein
MTTTSAQDRQERAAKNQSLFREINERVRDINESSYVFTILAIGSVSAPTTLVRSASRYPAEPTKQSVNTVLASS